MSAWIETFNNSKCYNYCIGRTLMSAWIETFR